MKKHNNGYYALLQLLNKHPEFTTLADNPCDAEIIALGKKLWAEWEANEKTVATVKRETSSTAVKTENRMAQLTATGKLSKTATEKLPITVQAANSTIDRQKETFKPALPEITAVQLRHVIQSTGTLRQAASVAGITVPQLRKMMVKFGIKKEVAAVATGH